MKELIQKKYANYVLKPFLQWYLKKDRKSKVQGFDLKVNTGVFHPAYFFSSLFFSEFIRGLDLDKKTFLDLGCGSGILALSAYKNGAQVTALDVSLDAVKNTKENFKLNFVNIEDEFKVVHSDLFSSIQEQTFDVIAINPPYFFKAAANDMEQAWNCGERGEYFYELFAELEKFCHQKTEVYMILAQSCDIERVKKIAAQSRFELALVLERKIKWESNYIYKLKPSM
jgi:release factor glutamine methyltransferase